MSDEQQRQLAEAQTALAALDGELLRISFNPDDPDSIEGALQQVNETISQRVGRYAGNPLVRPLIQQAKDRHRQEILRRAEATRFEDDHDDEEDDD